MRLMAFVLGSLLLVAETAAAQRTGDVEISIGGFELVANGAEKAAGVWFGANPRTTGKTTVGLFSMFGCGYFAVTVPPQAFEDNATAAWRVEITPLRVVNHAVTFRLRWVRAIDNGKAVTPASDDTELTLQPGESRPIDTVPVSPSAKAIGGRPCETRTASLRVVVDFPELDRRLVGADLWLVERLANGTEQSQLQSVRGLPFRPVPFYFDGVSDGVKRLDILGKFTADPEQGGLHITLETIRARADSGETGYQSVQWFQSALRLKPDETVEVALPPIEDSSGTFSKRVFSIRIRAKQLR
jgi:hypothetical protein